MAKDGREWVEKVQSEEAGGRARVMEFYSEYTRMYLWSFEQKSDMICESQKYYFGYCVMKRGYVYIAVKYIKTESAKTNQKATGKIQVKWELWQR